MLKKKKRNCIAELQEEHEVLYMLIYQSNIENEILFEQFLAFCDEHDIRTLVNNQNNLFVVYLFFGNCFDSLMN